MHPTFLFFFLIIHCWAHEDSSTKARVRPFNITSSTKLRHQCYPVNQGELLKITATSEHPHSVLFYHLADSLFAEVPIVLFPLSPFLSTYSPLIHTLKTGERSSSLTVCNQELLKDEGCQVPGKFVIAVQELDSEFINEVMETTQVMRIKDSGVWCMLSLGDGQGLTVSFEENEHSVYHLRTNFVLWCLIACWVISAGYSYKWKSMDPEGDIDHDNVKYLINMMCYYQGLKLLHLYWEAQGKTSLYWLTWTLQTLDNLWLYHNFYQFSKGDLQLKRGKRKSIVPKKNHNNEQRIFHGIVIVKQIFPIINPLLELFLWFKLYSNYKHQPTDYNSAYDNDNKPSSKINITTHGLSKNAPKLLIRVLFIFFFIQSTLLISYAFWETIMFENGYKSIWEQYMVIYPELKVLMLCDGGWISKFVVLMDDSAWCLVIGLLYYSL